MKILPLIITICVLTFACASSDDKSKIRIGSEGKLRGGSESTLAAVDYETLNALAKAQMANDKYGSDEIKFSGQIRLIPNGTKVLVIGGDWGAFEVRVLEGISAGKVVWVDASAVVEPNANQKK